MMAIELEIGFIIVLTAILAFLSTIESAVDELSEVQLRVLLAENEQGYVGRVLKELVETSQTFLLTLGLSTQILIVSITIVSARLFGHLKATESSALLWAFLVMLGVIGLFHQLVPRLLAQRDPARVLLLLLPALSVIHRGIHALAYPIYRVVQYQREKWEQVVAVEEEDTDDEIQAFIDVGEEEGIIEEGEGHLIQSIMELGDRRVAEVMTPRSEIVAVRSDTPVREALSAIIDSKYSRMPIYGDQLDDVEGVVHLRDLLKCWRAGREQDPVATIARAAYFVPETKSAGELLEEMRTSHTHIGLVIDEFGGIAGLITIGDLLEEIVGEIEEEKAGGNDDIVSEPNGSYLVKGSTEVRKIEELFEIEIDAEDYTTVAGLIIHQLKHLPATGERVQFGNLSLEVVDADRRRIREIRIQAVSSSARQSGPIGS